MDPFHPKGAQDAVEDVGKRAQPWSRSIWRLLGVVGARLRALNGAFDSSSPPPSQQQGKESLEAREAFLKCSELGATFASLWAPRRARRGREVLLAPSWAGFALTSWCCERAKGAERTPQDLTVPFCS